jgi:hypothetical protein
MTSNLKQSPESALERRRSPAIIRLADATACDAGALLASSGGFVFGRGLIATILATVLSFLCVLGVLAFHFPQYLTTPELRHIYSAHILRQIHFVSLLIAGAHQHRAG